MENNIIHFLLVNSNRLQHVPALLVAAVLGLLALLVYGVWWGLDRPGMQIVATFVLAANLVDWLALWLLPRAGRSFGPERPSTLALAVLRALLIVAFGLAGLPWWLALLVAGGLSLTAMYATWIEPFRLGGTHERFVCPDWPPNQPPLRLLHIGDLHIERRTSREDKLNQLVRDLRPDVIVFSGDFVNISYTHDATAAEHIRQVIGDWSAPLGVYCVPGTYTVEPIERVRQFVAGLDNLRLLEDEWVRLETPAGPLNILGMVTTHRLAQDRHTVAELARSAPGDGLRLLLTHAPDVAPEADAAGYDLYLCGHTHGGQLRLPLIGALFTGSALGRRFVMGRYDLTRTTVYTVRGVGLEGLGAPRARFLCPPEIVLWEISGRG
jgi:uncharacterized protein